MTHRLLTAQEIALARRVFGDTIDYARVRIYRRRFVPFQDKNTSMSPNGSIYMINNYRADFAREGIALQKHFIHEMAHVWQCQNNILNPVVEAVKLNLQHNFNYSAAYAYTLTRGRTLLSYNMEQQASIIEDYFAITHGTCWPYRGARRNDGTRADIIALYQSVLSDFPAQTTRRQPKPPQPPTA